MNTTAVEVPVISNLQSGMDYLSQLSLANPLVAERQLMSFVDALLMAPPESGVLLALLEQARAPMCFVEEEMARRYHNRALPLADEEESYFQQVVTAWRKMGKAYAFGSMGNRGGASMESHCNALVQSYDKAANDYEGMAATHKQMADMTKP